MGISVDNSVNVAVRNTERNSLLWNLRVFAEDFRNFLVLRMRQRIFASELAESFLIPVNEVDWVKSPKNKISLKKWSLISVYLSGIRQYFKRSFFDRNAKHDGLRIYFLIWKSDLNGKRLNLAMEQVELINCNFRRRVEFSLENDKIINIGLWVLNGALLNEFDRDDFFVSDVEVERMIDHELLVLRVKWNYF